MSIQSIGSDAASVTSFATPGTGTATKSRSPQAPTTTAEPTVTKPDSPANRDELFKAIKATNEFVGNINDNLQFSVDHDTGKTIVKVIDTNTKEVIKQIPSEEMIAIAKALDKLKGLLVQQKA